jgi:orotate phosphoribosyltransferase
VPEHASAAELVARPGVGACADGVAQPGAAGRRAALTARLRADGILWSTPEHPVRHRNGSTAPWMFYSWGVTTTAVGLELAAGCLLDRLATFESTQIAGHGMTAMPLVSACVALGGGRYTGLAIRKERKPYLSGRQVEGSLDTARPVVLVDDSLSSGTALRQAISALEAAGARVEGAVVLVTFPGRGGLEAATGNGYRIEGILDITADLGMPLHSPPRSLPDLPADPTVRLPDGLTPAALARLTAGHYLARRTLPTAPGSVAGSPDGRGGVFVSFRRRSDDHRLARDGFWHFDPGQFSPAADVVAATVRTLRTGDGAVTATNLEQLKIAVTFLGPMEQIPPAALDFDRYAIVVTDPPRVRAGGALPNSQVFTSEVQQYRHARERNARLSPTEPHLLYRQTVTKDVEAGESWPGYGVPDPPSSAWATDPAVGRALLARATSLVRRRTDHTRGRGGPGGTGGPGPSELPELPGPAREALTDAGHAVAVTLYRQGTIGFGIAWADVDSGSRSTGGAAGHHDTDVGVLLDRAVEEALRSAATVPPGAIVMVHVLHEPERLGRCGVRFAAVKVRKGLDAIRCDDGDRRVVLLPTALVYNGWTEEEFVAAAARRAVGPAATDRVDRTDRVDFTTYRCASWVSVHGAGVRPVRSGFPVRSPVTIGHARSSRPISESDSSAPAPGEPEIRDLVGYTLRNASPQGVPLYHLQPVTGRRTPAGTGPRQLHALLGVQRAAELLGEPIWTATARRGLETYLAAGSASAGPATAGGFADGAGGPLADAVAFAALGVPGGPFADRPAVRRIGARLTAMVRSTGVVSAQPVRLDVSQDLEFLPGAVLVALAVDPSLLAAIPTGWWPRIREVHRQRFRVLHRWGLVGWQLQAWSAIQARTGEDADAALVFEVADWALDRQLATSGAFLETLSEEEPSFNTGFVAEGMAAAWATALRVGDRERATRYRRSWQRAGTFMRTLLIGSDDLFCLASGSAALGGVRLTPSRPDIRADSVSHWLNALVTGASLERPQPQA